MFNPCDSLLRLQVDSRVPSCLKKSLGSTESVFQCFAQLGRKELGDCSREKGVGSRGQGVKGPPGSSVHSPPSTNTDPHCNRHTHTATDTTTHFHEIHLQLCTRHTHTLPPDTPTNIHQTHPQPSARHTNKHKPDTPAHFNQIHPHTYTRHTQTFPPDTPRHLHQTHTHTYLLLPDFTTSNTQSLAPEQ